MSAWGLYIFISMWFKIFCLIREQHTDAWNIVHKIFSTSSKKKNLWKHQTSALRIDAVYARNVWVVIDMAWSDAWLLETWPTRGACSFISECCNLPLKPCWLLYILHNSYLNKETGFNLSLVRRAMRMPCYRKGGKAQSLLAPRLETIEFFRWSDALLCPLPCIPASLLHVPLRDFEWAKGSEIVVAN